jgi:tetratricopeptide (TPR) repeat protein
VSEPAPVDPQGAAPAVPRWIFAAAGAAVITVVGVGVWGWTTSPERVFQRGLDAMRAGNDSEALAAFDRYLERWPESAAAHHNRGVVRCRAGDHFGASSDFGAAAREERDPKKRGRDLTSAGSELSHIGRYDDMIVAFEQAIGSGEPPRVVFLERARAKRHLGDSYGAVEDAGRALEHAPGDEHSLVERALANQDLEALDDALADLDRAVALSPSAPGPRGFRAVARVLAGDLDGARDDAGVAVKLGPDDAAAHACRSLVLRLDGKIDDAIASARRAHELSPRYGWPLYESADAHVGRGEWAAALTDLDAAERLYHNVGGVLWLRGFVHALAGERSVAFTDLTRSREHRPKDFHAPLWLAALGGDASSLEPHAKGDGWRARLARFVLGRETEADLVAFASSSSRPWEKRARLATAHAFAGILAERANDRARSLDHYRAAVAENAIGWYVHTWSKARLAAAQEK